MDYAKIIPLLLKYVTPDKLADLVKFYEANKDLINALFQLLARRPEEVKPPATPPIEPPKPVATHRIRTILGKVFYFEDDRHGGSGGTILEKPVYDAILSPSGPDAQMKGQRAHLDFTPYDENGVEVPREEVRKLVKPNGEPMVRIRCSSQSESLESFADRDVGFTPVYLLDEQIGSGRHKVEAVLTLDAEFNNGVEVESNIVGWYAD
jgi:hypothetical protein